MAPGRLGFIMVVRALIVDDSGAVRDELRAHLECIGCEVVAEAENTLQALALFRTVSPSLVIIDVAAPQTGGIGALALLRIMHRQNSATQVLMVGSGTLPEMRKSFFRDGAADYLLKSVLINGIEQMRKRIEELFPELKRLAPFPSLRRERNETLTRVQ